MENQTTVLLSNPEERQKFLNLKRSTLDQKPKAFVGNTKARSEYVNLIDKEYGFYLFQFSVILGLVLSDASLKYNDPKTALRLTIQQSKSHIEFLKYIFIVLEEFVPKADSNFNAVSSERSEMFELTTFTFPSLLNSIRDLFYSSPTSTTKEIRPELLKYINEVVLAFWFMGDGAKKGGNTQSKALELSTHCFNKAQNEELAKALQDIFGFDVEVKREKDKYDKLVIPGRSYDAFVEKIGPYILDSFDYRIPSGRSNVSQFGSMTQTMRNAVLGSAYKQNQEELIVNYKPKYTPKP